MKRFINSQSKKYHHSVIENFSDTSKFLTSGLVKGHNTKEYSWIADMLFKNTGNLSLNPHVGYISFFSDREIMYQEFGNVEEIYTEYPFFSDWERAIFSDLTFELETKQYFKIGQSYAEFDLIEYINPSEFITAPVDGYTVNHQYYRAPVFHAEGYKLDMDDDAYESFNKYLWSLKVAGNGDDLTLFSIGEYLIKLSLFNGDKDKELSDANYTLYSSHTGDIERILDYKIHADNPRYKYFESGIKEWVYYYNETTHYQSGTFYPYIGTVSIFTGEDWVEKVAPYGYSLFPEIIINGVLEPAKAIVNWVYEDDAPKGRLSFNAGNHLNDAKDQSRIIYNVCSSMINEITPGKFFVKEKLPGVETIDGIDINTERNRRYSSVVMTEPYFVTEPLGNGQLVEYSFVFSDGDPVESWSDNRPMYLKIKASLNIFSEIDTILNSTDYNTDIINVLSMSSEDYGNLLSEPNYYDDFGSSSSVFINRQNNCLDDLVNGIVGTGHYKEYYIDSTGYPLFSQFTDKYLDSKVKVCGMGIEYYGDDSISRVNFYCSNYVPIASPPPGTIPTPKANDPHEILSFTFINKISGPEIFKPMIKLSGMNGYVKIMNKNTSFNISRSSDGKYEIVYNVEFPYCPGSKDVRNSMDFSSGNTISGFIYKKKSYINAGSQEADSTYNSRYDAGNDRYAPYGEDSFCKFDIFFQSLYPGEFVNTDPFGKGGGINTPLKSVISKQVTYPVDLVWTSDSYTPNLFSLTKPKFLDFKRYGTYEINFQADSITKDMKMFCLVDNRQWKFSEDKFASYIGRENPSYVFEIDASTLFEDFTKFQALHGSIPDKKRWLYGYFTGFSHTLLSNDLDVPATESEKLGTAGNNSDLLSNDSKSDITVEIWDQESDLGNSQKGNWRPFVALSSDNHKIPGSIIVDNVFVSESGVDNPSLEFEDIYSVYICYMLRDESNIPKFTFPETVVSSSGSVDLLDGQSNLILYDKDDNISLHIAYIKRVNDPLYTGDPLITPRTVYKAYVKSTTGLGIFKTIDVNSITEIDISQYQIRFPFKTLTKNPRFSTSTIRAVDGVDLGVLTKYLDIRGDGDTYSDYERFLLGSKIYFRVRVVKGKKHSSSYLSKDLNDIPYVGSEVGDDTDLNRGWLNFPWYDNLGVAEDAFDWAKIKTEETMRKFGLNYFKCASK